MIKGEQIMFDSFKKKSVLKSSSAGYELVSGDFERKEYSYDEKKMITDYMKSIKKCGVVAGHMIDCVTEKEVKKPDWALYADSLFFWSSKDIYHIEKYNAAVKDEFLDHVKNKNKAPKSYKTRYGKLCDNEKILIRDNSGDNMEEVVLERYDFEFKKWVDDLYLWGIYIFGEPKTEIITEEEANILIKKYSCCKDAILTDKTILYPNKDIIMLVESKEEHNHDYRRSEGDRGGI